VTVLATSHGSVPIPKAEAEATTEVETVIVEFTEKEEATEMVDLFVTNATKLGILLANAPRTTAVAEVVVEAADLCATAVTALVTLPANAQRAMAGMIAAAVEEIATMEAEVADPNVTSVTGSGILHENAVKKRTAATNATEPDTLQGIVTRKKIRATTVIRSGIL